MNLFHYTRYFIYITRRWDIKLACYTIYHEIRGERKYKLKTSRLDDLQKLTLKGDIEHAAIYQGANYYLLEDIFNFLENEGVNQSIVDFGCGKGRVLAVASHYGFTKIAGIEFARELCELARKNIIPLQQAHPEKIFNVIYMNAVDYEIEPDTNVFFFFNPFDEVIMLQVAKNILKSLKEHPREVFVVYVNPVHDEIFLSAGFEQVYFFEKFEYITAAILQKSPGDPGAY